MNRLLLGLAAVAVLGATVALSRTLPTTGANAPAADLQIVTGDKNPWTGLKLNNDPDQFQFAIVSDRTGGHRAKVFSRAVHQINLLQPEFVMSVGDLIEGYSTDKEKVEKMWDEFDSYSKKFDMPFFYVPGNHDLTNKQQIELWGGRYGKTHYHFVYKNTLFIAVNSEDGAASTVTPAQQEAIRKALAENPNARWTLLFLHKPLWTHKDLEKNGWLGVEKALEGRKYTVFCGHVHRYQKFVRNGMNYYQLATTGGGSKLRGTRYGEFDHVVWMTMKKDGPLMANVMLDGVLAEDLSVPDTDEKGSPTYELLKAVPMNPTRAVVRLDGKPAAGVTVTLHGQPLPTMKERAVADGLTGADGVAVLTTLRDGDGVPAGEYRVTVTRSSRGGYYDGEPGERTTLPAKYASKETSGLATRVVAGINELLIEMTSK
jgi:hypothetical protein